MSEPSEARGESRSAKVLYCDVVVVGGGIAGVSIAERLAREASRQGKTIKVVLVERQEELGGGASGNLEGWYHAGSLYSKLPDPRFFITSLNALEDMYNWYRFDPMVSDRLHCNLKDLQGEDEWPHYQWTPEYAENWFVDEIVYLLPREVTGTTEAGTVRFDRNEWEETSERVLSFVHQAFCVRRWNVEGEWTEEERKWTQEDRSRISKQFGGFYQVPPEDIVWQGDLSREELADLLRAEVDTFTRHSVLPRDGRWSNLFASIVDLDRPEPEGRPREVDALISRDAVMNAWQVLTDLASNASKLGVEFIPGCTLTSDSVQLRPFGPSDQISGVVLERANGQGALHIIAKQHVFAMGIGFDTAFLYEKLNVPVRVEKRISVMAVARPALWPCSFAVLDHSRRKDFNHIYHPWTHDGKGGGFSIFADSSALPENATPSDQDRAAGELLRKAELLLRSATLQGRRLHWYACVKTEFIHDDRAQRDYSYSFRPIWERPSRGAERDVWGTARQVSQRATQNRILMHVSRCGPGESCDLEGLGIDGITEADTVLGRSTWAIKKAFHFALQRFVHAGLHRDDGIPPPEALTDFTSYRDYAVDQLESSARKPNYLCVIPGKFSFFPTLAYQVYTELEVRGLFQHLDPQKGEPVASESTMKDPPRVVDPRAERLLGGAV